MTEKVKNPKIEMINEIIFLNKIASEMWQYHPNNPQQINVVTEYQQVQDKIEELQNKISELDK
jgi:translation initiation factor IF-2